MEFTNYLNGHKMSFPFGEENKNVRPLYELLDNKQYKIFMKTEKYKQMPYLHMAYYFEYFPKRLADPYVDGNFLIN